jgi:uncharacterized membrane protein YtjA (UPF0391 family)
MGRLESSNAGGVAMSLLKWSLIFLVVALVAGVLGFSGIAEGAADISKFLFVVFLVIFGIFVVLGLTIYRSVT